MHSAQSDPSCNITTYAGRWYVELPADTTVFELAVLMHGLPPCTAHIMSDGVTLVSIGIGDEPPTPSQIAMLWMTGTPAVLWNLPLTSH